jgi:hypothetical protein
MGSCKETILKYGVNYYMALLLVSAQRTEFDHRIVHINIVVNEVALGQVSL